MSEAEPFNQSGYTGLIAAMIVQAFRDLRCLTSADGHSPETVRNKAWAWMHDQVTYAPDVDSSPDPKRRKMGAYRTDEAGGYEWCCSVLGLDPERYRQLSLTREGINKVLGKHGSNQHERK